MKEETGRQKEEESDSQSTKTCFQKKKKKIYIWGKCKVSSQGSTRLLHDVQGTDKRKMFLSASGAFVYLVPMNQPNLEKKTSEARDKIGMRSCHRNYPND